MVAPDKSPTIYTKIRTPHVRITSASKKVSIVPRKIATTGSETAGSFEYGSRPLSL